MRWRIGFLAAAEPATGWWQRLLRPGYAHVWASRRLWRGLWLWAEWTPERIILGVCGPDLVRRASVAAHEVLVFDAGVAGEPRRWRLAWPHLLDCVTLVADTVGVRVPPWCTPWRLRCALRRRGAFPLRRPGRGGVPA
ncbi:hypothetical protein [Caldovatus aquaticus]|uniref:Uncharacterized protein n=1 Tax=Caldovatus aquaticus TaxID=2865671 RepID=A0ABS7EYJ2_9PROT|nr:hypothetical protein [Caldovatus aquaticus]MBW8268294.1 hypothetical protein [Caldovatus aquaticus]